jgi:hypothetical protein
MKKYVSYNYKIIMVDNIATSKFHIFQNSESLFSTRVVC